MGLVEQVLRSTLQVASDILLTCCWLDERLGQLSRLLIYGCTGKKAFIAGVADDQVGEVTEQTLVECRRCRRT